MFNRARAWFDKRLLISVGMLAVLVAVVAVAGVWPQAQDAAAVWVAVDSSTREVRWNFGPRDDGQQPDHTEGSKLVGQYGGYCMGNPDEKVIYLTFDMGYENGYMPAILDTLKEHNVPAAFFLVGHYFDSAPDMVKRMVDEGHIVGNHTGEHKNMAKITGLEAFQAELATTEQKYEELTGGQMPKFYRPPEGVVSELSLQYAQQLGYTTVLWSLAYKDWEQDNQPSHDYAYGKLLPRTHNGAIVLLHGTSKTNSEILGGLITEWRNMGYEFRSLNELK